MTEVLASRPDWPQRPMLDEIRTLGGDLVRHLRETEDDL
jgi:hypothetical protein